MKITLKLTLIIMLVALSSSLYTAKSQKDTERAKVKNTLVNFINLCRNNRYKEAYKYTTGKEKKAHSLIVNRIKANYGKVPKNISNYFARLKHFYIEALVLDKKLTKALAICRFRFQYVDSVSRDSTRKDRTVHYYVVKENGKWLITFSKIDAEDYIYHSKTKNRWNKKK
ncbi:MAG: hypothetical protein OEZ36_00570 [Spirochaetota bacterium]|nr:hypothetical protein [Spirochaetota bacterium]